MADSNRVYELERLVGELFAAVRKARADAAAALQYAKIVGSAPRNDQPAGGGGEFYVGTASGLITGRSGTTPGSGTVAIVDASGGTLAATGATKAVKNAGASIANGKYCGVQEDEFGTFWAAALEC
jgi:hypothetical protein